MKVAVITGGSSGIGLCTVKALLSSGCIVYELSRRNNKLPGIHHISVDVTDEENIYKAIHTIYEKERRIDILINCAGFGISGAVEYTRLEDAKRQIDVNFFGVVNTTKAVLPYMREAGAGRIVNVSSVAAVAPIPFQTYYSVSKAAINSYSCALANEMKTFGITVTAIMPGDIKTGFTEARVKSPDGDVAYNGRISKSVEKMEHDELNGMNAQIAGDYICKIALKKHVKPLYSIGSVYKLLSVLCMILPCSFKNWLIGKLYG